MASTFLPDTFRDNPSYAIDNNPQFELGWREVLGGLNKVLFGHALSISGVLFLVWITVGIIDLSIAPRGKASKVDWTSVLVLIGVIVFLNIQFYSFWTVLRGQWQCTYAPERRHAKAFMFSCMLCIVAMPLLNLGAMLLGGVENAFAVNRGRAGATEYMQLASCLLGMLSSILFVCFLRAVAICFESKLTEVLATLYVVFALILVAASLYLTVGYQHAFKEYTELTGLAQGKNVLIQLGLLLIVGLGWVFSYLWFLALLVVVRQLVAQHVATPRRALSSQ